MNFKVNDLLFFRDDLIVVNGIKGEPENKYIVKFLRTTMPISVEQIFDIDVEKIDRFCKVYDFDNPPTKTVNKGSVICNQCGTKLKLGDYCVRDNYGDIYCSEECLLESCAEESEILEGDLTESETISVPTFDVTFEEYEKVKKEVSEHATTK